MLPTVSLVLTGLTVFLGYFTNRIDFQGFILAYSAFFGVYAFLVFRLESTLTAAEQRWLCRLGIGLRVILLFSLPALSDDYVRFLWDGHLTAHGFHPFAHPPRYYFEQQVLPPGIAAALFSKLNSPDYFSVYPPVCQAVFAVAAWLAPQSVWGGILVIKLFLLAFEIGSIRLLQRHAGAMRAVWYALNPLAILEIVGNCHFEGAMIFFLLWGLIELQRRPGWRAAAAWALAIASKMLPLLFLPLVWRYLGWRKGWIFIIRLGLICLLLFAPILWAMPHILESLDLYFRQFQFNAGLYYLVREVGFAKIGWDIGEFSGPALGGLTFTGVCWLAIRLRSKAPEALPAAMLFALFLYLSCAATVQPWYATVPLAISLLTRWRFPIVWSGLIALSYSHYDKGAFQENFLLITLEYLLLWIFIGMEIWKFRRRVNRADDPPAHPPRPARR
jgi:hypothetical protein